MYALSYVNKNIFYYPAYTLNFVISHLMDIFSSRKRKNRK